MKYKGYTIEQGYYYFEFVHEDYDGAPDYAYGSPTDPRCGHGNTIEDCKKQIDEIEENLQDEIL